MKREKSPFYSIVIPIHNEEDNLIPLFAKIGRVLHNKSRQSLP